MNWIKSKKTKNVLLVFLLCAVFILPFITYINRYSDFTSINIVLCAILASSLLLFQKQLRNIGMVLVSIGACVLFIELVLLGLFLIGGAATRIEGSYAGRDASKTYWGRSELGYQPNPGVYTSREISSTGDIIYDVDYTIDGDRARVTAAESIRSNTPVLINFFGGSFLFGEGLNDNETLPYYVSQLLHVPVKNYGAQGYGAHQAYYIMSNFKLIPENQINVFLTSAFHSERSYCNPTYSLLSPRYVIQDTEHGSQIVQDGVCRDPIFGEMAPLYLEKVLSRFRLYSIVRKAVIARRTRKEEFELYIQLIKSMHDLSEAQNRMFVVIYLDAEDDYFRRSDYSNEDIVRFLEEYGINVLNLSLIENGVLPRRYYLHDEDRHPSAIANQVRAQLLAAELKTMLNYVMD